MTEEFIDGEASNGNGGECFGTVKGENSEGGVFAGCINDDTGGRDVISEARNFYLGGGGTLRAVSERFNIPYGRLCRISSSELWGARRRLALADFTDGALAFDAEAVRHMGTELPEAEAVSGCGGISVCEGGVPSEHSDGSLNEFELGISGCPGDKAGLSGSVERLCGMLAARIGSYIADGEQFNRYLIKGGKDAKGAETVEAVFDKADVKSIKEMAQALKALSECASNLLHGSDSLGQDVRETEKPEADFTVRFIGGAERFSE